MASNGVVDAEADEGNWNAIKEEARLLGIKEIPPGGLLGGNFAKFAVSNGLDSLHEAFDIFLRYFRMPFSEDGFWNFRFYVTMLNSPPRGPTGAMGIFDGAEIVDSYKHLPWFFVYDPDGRALPKVDIAAVVQTLTGLGISVAMSSHQQAIQPFMQGQNDVLPNWGLVEGISTSLGLYQGGTLSGLVPLVKCYGEPGLHVASLPHAAYHRRARTQEGFRCFRYAANVASLPPSIAANREALPADADTQQYADLLFLTCCRRAMDASKAAQMHSCASRSGGQRGFAKLRST